MVSSQAQPSSGALQATAVATNSVRRVPLCAPPRAHCPVVNNAGDGAAATIEAMQFFDRRASAAFIWAFACIGNLHAQDGSTNTVGIGVSANNTAPAGPGLIVRSWRSATDWQAWQDSRQWRFVVSPFSHHFRRSDEHRYVWAIGMEKQRADDWIAGASFFSNSFGQPSSYTYVGKRFPQLWGQPQLFGQVSAGLMYGYRGKFQNKVPLNYKGFSPGALVSMGWQFTPRTGITAHLLGDAGMMLQLSYELN